ncbi:MAG: universal stress protein [Candidatus Obscuribacterales bacterium]|nr:universal stress protein [Candidatus Obscuribacterales bacterium]
MLLTKILVPVDGSTYSQLAIDYAFWLAEHLDGSVTAQHIIDPRLLDMIIAPEFAASLGFAATIDASDKALVALKMIGKTILDLVKREAKDKVEVETFLDVGWILEQILERSAAHDLVIVGHHGKRAEGTLANTMIGSVAERVAVLSKKSVLVATKPIVDVKEIAVAFDGSESSRGALLLAESLAIKTKKPLKAVVVAQSESKEHMAAAHLTVEQGSGVLREMNGQAVFSILQGSTTKTILRYVTSSDALLILGAYGYRTPEENVLGSTTTGVIRQASTSVLIFR